MTERAPAGMPSKIQSAIMKFERLKHAFPDTPFRKLTQKDKALQKRRARSKAARTSRKVNRRRG